MQRHKIDKSAFSVTKKKGKTIVEIQIYIETKQKK